MEVEGFYRAAIKEIDAKIAQTDQSILSGTGVADWTVYKGLVEKRRALLDTRDILRHIWDGFFKREPVPDRTV